MDVIIIVLDINSEVLRNVTPYSLVHRFPCVPVYQIAFHKTIIFTPCRENFKFHINVRLCFVR
jgi:hypothetical protein